MSCSATMRPLHFGQIFVIAISMAIVDYNSHYQLDDTRTGPSGGMFIFRKRMFDGSGPAEAGLMVLDGRGWMRDLLPQPL